jgi:hypothetical protein
MTGEKEATPSVQQEFLLYAFGFFKGTVTPVRVWLKVVWLERAKMGEESLSVFKIFHSFFDF